tara:strand:- start:1861 stop:2052 length:192 start_codon:yes stop_codon:yes gene_type:complete
MSFTISPYGLLHNYLLDYEIATQEELILVCSINGNTTETLESVLYVRTGYRSLDQILEAEKSV